MSIVRVALADDHPLVLMGIKSLVEAESDLAVSTVSTDGASAWRAISAYPPDVAVIDISMPEVDGIALAKRLKTSFPSVRLLVLTVHEDEGYIQLALRAGVDGYLLKRSAAEEIVRAIRCIAAGLSYIDPAIGMPVAIPHAPDRSPPSPLSDRESDVLRLLGQGYATKEIAQRLGIGAKSVETYKSRATKKLGLGSRAQIVRFAIGQGWLPDY